MPPLVIQDIGYSPKHLDQVSARCKVESIGPRALLKLKYTRMVQIIHFVQMKLFSPSG